MTTLNLTAKQALARAIAKLDDDARGDRDAATNVGEPHHSHILARAKDAQDAADQIRAVLGLAPGHDVVHEYLVTMPSIGVAPSKTRVVVTASTLTDNQILAVMDEACKTSDEAMAQTCLKALNGDERAEAKVVEAINAKASL